MYKDYRYINAGENEYYRYGKDAQERLAAFLEPNENGYYSVPVDGGKYWTFGTSEGKYGEFIKYGDTFFSVNNGGYAYCKADSPKAEAFVKMVGGMLEAMKKENAERLERLKGDEDEYLTEEEIAIIVEEEKKNQEEKEMANTNGEFLQQAESPKEYLVFDEKIDKCGNVGDAWVECFDTAEEAEAYAEGEWNHLTEQEKKSRRVYVLRTANPDPDAEDHFDGDIIKEF